MKKTSRKKRNKRYGQVSLQDEKLARLKDLCRVGLREKVEILAGYARVLIGQGSESLFLTAVTVGDDLFFVPSTIDGDEHEEKLKGIVMELAKENGGDSIVSATWGWAAPHHSPLRPSEDPGRKEILVVVAKDHFNQIAATQEVHRHGEKCQFEELEFTDSVKSWLDDCPVLDPAQAANEGS